MSNLSQKDPPELSVATTGRSKCQRCREPILQGEQRAGVLTRAALLFVRAMYGAGLLHSVRIYGTGQLVRHGMHVCACQPECAVVPCTVAPQAGGHGRPFVRHFRAQVDETELLRAQHARRLRADRPRQVQPRPRGPFHRQGRATLPSTH